MIRVKIDGVECAPVLPQRLAPDYDAGSLTDPDSWREGRAVKLRLPSTPATDRLMRHADDIYAHESFNLSLHRATIEADGTVIFGGTATLSGITRVGRETFYEVTVRDGGAKWARDAARTMLRDTGIDFTAVLDNRGIAATWQGSSDMRMLPVIRDSYSTDPDASGVHLPQQTLMPHNYHPFLSIDAIMRSVFDRAGYEVRSAFMQGELFRSLCMSGAYPSVDTAAARARMDFLARRTRTTTAEADSEGIVYVWEPVMASNIGAFVDTVSPGAVNDEGEAMGDVFSTGGCMTFPDGRPVFRPVRELAVAFEYYIKYATDYRIASRTRLAGFDAIHLDVGCDVEVALENPFADRRGSLRPSFSYRIVVFDHAEGDRYRLGSLASFDTRPALFSTPDTLAGEPQLTVCRKGGTTYAPYTGDWAIYDGYIGETGVRDVELTVVTPPRRFTPTSPATFNAIYFHGAEEGQRLTLSNRCRLRPLFAAQAGYGSVATFADAACHRISQLQIVEAVRQMFNLQIFCDNSRKRVYIEPYDRFFDRPEVDWRGRQIVDSEQRWHDTMLDRHERRTWRYAQGDGVAGRFEAETGATLGSWTFLTKGYGTLLGDEVQTNPVFAPSVSQSSQLRAAPAAALLRVGDRDADDREQGFTPRIVIYKGLARLPSGQTWTQTGGAQYPLAAFHFAGDELNEGFTLCFEDRDGLTGLHRHYDGMLAAEAARQTLVCDIRLEPSEYADLFDLESGGADIRSTFRLRAGDESSLFTLRAVERYDPESRTARCRFMRTMRD